MQLLHACLITRLPWRPILFCNKHAPTWTVTARGLRGKPIGPGREVRTEPKLELPKLRGGLPMLRTGIRWAGT